MYENLDLFRTSSLMARYAGSRQALIATNLANADTPGYRATAMPSFAQAYSRGFQGEMRSTRAGHLSALPPSAETAMIESSAEPSPDGNSVAIETEMLSAAEAQRDHSRALAIYRHGMTVLRTVLGR